MNSYFISIIRGGVFLISLMAVLLAFALPGAAQDLENYTYRLTQSTTGYQFWTTPPAERVFKDNTVPTETGSDVKVYAAKNEFEPFQVVVITASSGAVTVSIGDFGSGITTEIYQVKYVNITQATDSLGKTGPYPDPLWPLENGQLVSLTANENCAFWFSVSVPKTTAAGDYTANVQIAGVDIPVTLHVFDFAVPDELHIKSQMNFSHYRVLTRYSVSGTEDDYWMYVNKMKQFFIDHRLTPKDTLWPGGLTSSGGAPFIDYDCETSTLTDNDKIGGFEINASKYINGDEITGQAYNNGIFNKGTGFPSFMCMTFQYNDASADQRPSTFCSQTGSSSDWYSHNNPSSSYNTEWFKYITAIQNYLTNLGYIDEAYYYFANAPQDQADYDAVAWYSQELKKVAPNLKLMISEEPKSQIYNHSTYTGSKIDIWLSLLDNYDPTRSHDREKNHGEETWISFLHSTRPPYFNPITLDHPGVEGKLTGWFLWKYRIRGIAHYSMNGWSNNPWTDPIENAHNGDLFMLYPPSESNSNITYGSNNHRFVPSIRFELMRDSLEDYEYLYILNGGTQPKVDQANSSDTQADKIISGLTSYTRDTKLMYNLRRYIGLKNGNEIASIPENPVIVNVDGDSLSYTEDGPAQPLDTGADAAVSDVYTSNYKGGYLMVHFAANGTPSDRLTIDTSGSITLTGAEVFHNGTSIGDIDGTFNGINGSDLKIVFDTSEAGDAAVGALIQTLRFSNTSQTPATASRTVEITLNNGARDSNTATVTANVTAVKEPPLRVGFTGAVNGLWGASGSDVFIVGTSGRILHYDGSTWINMNSGMTETVYGVWGSSGSDIFAVGASGSILHYNGSAWSAMTSGTAQSLYGVWGSSANDVFAVGALGTILHYNGSAWSGMSSGTTETFYGVWGSSASDVFAVGASGTVRHYDGSAWNAMTSGTTETLYGVWGSSGSDVFAVGDSGTIMNYDGSAWNAMDSGTTNTLRWVWGTSVDEIFVTEDSGSIPYGPRIIINEILADPGGDANNDGTPSATEDEFVEIVNDSGTDADMSGWTLSDNTTLRHTFPAGTVIPDGCAVLVFGGGSPSGLFGNVTVQTASTGTLDLNDGGDTLTLINNASINVAVFTYTTGADDSQSLTRDPDITGLDAAVVKHSTAAGSGGSAYSPGTKVDGSYFTGCNSQPTVSTIPDVNVNEDAADTVIDLHNYFADAEDADKDLTYTVVSNSKPTFFDSCHISSTATTDKLILDYKADTSGDNAKIVVRATDTGALYRDTEFLVNICPVNDRPGFTASNPPAVNRNSGAQTIPGWISSFTPGPADESGQTAISYTVSDISNTGLLLHGPAVATDGTLTYTPGNNQSGSTTFKVTVQDNGGTANGGADTSASQTFTITVNAAGVPPVIPVPPVVTITHDTQIITTGTVTNTNTSTDITIGQGATVTNFGTLIDLHNSGTVNGGVVSGNPVNDGLMNNITLPEGTTLNNAAGTLSNADNAGKVFGGTFEGITTNTGVISGTAPDGTLNASYIVTISEGAVLSGGTVAGAILNNGVLDNIILNSNAVVSFGNSGQLTGTITIIDDQGIACVVEIPANTAYPDLQDLTPDFVLTPQSILSYAREHDWIVNTRKSGPGWKKGAVRSVASALVELSSQYYLIDGIIFSETGSRSSGMVDMIIPFEPENIPDSIDTSNIIALIYNHESETWETVSYTVEGNSVRIKTDLISSVALVAEAQLLVSATTDSVSGISHISALVSGTAISDGNTTIRAKGICWSTSPNPTTGDNKTNEGAGAGSFKSVLTRLAPNTRYSVRTYVTSELGTVYGNKHTLTTFTSMVNSYLALTDNCTAEFTIPANALICFFGSATEKRLKIKTGARMELQYLVAGNQIRLEESALEFCAYRSGATVYLVSTMGTVIKMPAGLTAQSLYFSDGRSDLVIYDEKVMLGEQEITMSATMLKAPGNNEQPVDIPSTTLPGDIDSYLVLTDQSPGFTIPCGAYAQVVGSAGINTINVESGAQVVCRNFAGANMVNIDEQFIDLTIYRKGSTVYMDSKNGTHIEIPATTTGQHLNFKYNRYELIILYDKVICQSSAGAKVVNIVE